MNGTGYPYVKRITAFILAAMMIFIVMFSLIFITAHVHHECTGEDCPVCACIEMCESMLRQAGDGMTVLPSVIIPIIASVFFCFLPVVTFAQDTLVSRKVRIND
ncbi:MAG: hypothetical protein IKQ40_02475 [Lachnospiraceae bacterium]|nr:hypothetical protein [Lachnospiraceae bacterium]